MSAGTKQRNAGTQIAQNDMSAIVTMKAVGLGFSVGVLTVTVATPAGWFVTTTFCIGDIKPHIKLAVYRVVAAS